MLFLLKIIYITNNDDKKVINECKNHYKKFESYCHDCNEDICSDCSYKSDIHKRHTTTSFKIDNNKVKDIRNTIEEYENESEDTQNVDKDNIIEIFKIIIKYYNDPSINLLSLIEYPCQYYVETIDILHNYLEQFKNKENKDKSSIMSGNINSDKIKYTLRSKLNEII